MNNQPRTHLRIFLLTVLISSLAAGGCSDGSFFRTFTTDPSESETTEILLIGNSLSGWWDVQTHFQKMIEAGERKAHFDYSIIGGTALVAHLGYYETMKKVEEGIWDYVILQEGQWALPFPLSEGRARAIQGYVGFRDATHRYNPHTRMVMFLDWMNLDSMQGIDSDTGDTLTWNRGEFQDMMTDAALDLADSLKFMVAPIGEAWRRVMDERPDITMMNKDALHPNDAGGYLQACVYYATIFRKSPENLPYWCMGIPQEDSDYLQRIAAETVLTQKGRWRIP